MLTQKNSSALMGPVVIAWSGRDKEAHSLISIKVIAWGKMLVVREEMGSFDDQNVDRDT